MVTKFSHSFFSRPLEIFNGKVPFIVSDLIIELEKRNSHKVEGIFRLNGSDTKTKLLIDELENGHANFSAISDIHTISTTLKRYFRQMGIKEPLIPVSTFNEIVDVIRTKEKSLIDQYIFDILEKLPKGRFLTLVYLFKYLRSIADNELENHMSPNNISICFAPNLIVLPEDQTSSSYLSTTIVTILISNFNQIFYKINLTDDDLCDEKDILLSTKCPYTTHQLYQMIIRTSKRTQSVIPYVSNVNLRQIPCFERPTRPPPNFDIPSNNNNDLEFEEISDYDYISDNEGEEKNYTYVYYTDSDNCED